MFCPFSFLCYSTSSIMSNDSWSSADSDDENTPLFDENTTPRSLRRVRAYKFHLCGHDSCSCALPFIRLLESYRPASTPSKTWLETCNANLTMSATLKTAMTTTTLDRLPRNVGVSQGIPQALMTQVLRKQRQKKSSVLDDDL